MLSKSPDHCQLHYCSCWCSSAVGSPGSSFAVATVAADLRQAADSCSHTTVALTVGSYCSSRTRATHRRPPL